ncbi:MAG TPA: response regulator [Opitutus sp.]|nr:response regulator [Opitutus sp.]
MSHHILIVDDEAPIREMLKLALTKQGYRVTTASSTAEAGKVVKDDPPQLVITDLQLEDSDGMGLIARLKAAQPQLPVILLTGVLFDQQVVEETFADKISVYLHKTSPLSTIVREVKRCLDR